VDNLLRLRYPRHRQTPILLKRVNAHAERRELSTSVLAILLKFGVFRITRIKSGRSISYVLISLSVHWHICFKVRTFLLTNLQIS